VRQKALRNDLSQNLAERFAVAGRELLPETSQLGRENSLFCWQGRFRLTLDMGLLLESTGVALDTSVPAATTPIQQS
jgi:hypothetical protein